MFRFSLDYSVIPDKGPASEDPRAVKKIVFCSGRVYYDLTKARTEGQLEKEIAISRVEQVSGRFLFTHSD